MRHDHNHRATEQQLLADLQLQVLRAIRDEGLSYPDVAARYGITVAEVEAAFAEALVTLAAAEDDRLSWPQRLIRRLLGARP